MSECKIIMHDANHRKAMVRASLIFLERLRNEAAGKSNELIGEGVLLREKRLTQEEKAKIVGFRELGWSWRKIAEETGHPYSTIYRWFNHSGGRGWYE